MPTQLLDYPFSGGVDEKTQSQLVEPGSALSVVNTRQLKNGSYQKRLGYSPISNSQLGGGSVPACKRLIAYKDELLQTDGLGLYSFSPTAGVWKQPQGHVPQLGIYDQPVFPLQRAVRCYASAYVNGYHAVTYCLSEDDGFGTHSILVSLYDAKSGTIVWSPGVVSTNTGARPRITMIAAGNYAVMVYSFDGLSVGTNIYCQYLDTSSAASIAFGWTRATLVTNALEVDGFTNAFDACGLGGGMFAVAYALPNGSTSMIQVTTFTSPATQVGTTTVVCAANPAADPPRTVAISGSLADTLWVAFPFENGNIIKAIGLNPNTLSTTATTATVITMSGGTQGSLAVTWTGTGTGILMSREQDDFNPEPMYVRNFTKSGGAVVPALANQFVSFGFQPDSKPFVANGRVYMTVRTDATFEADPGQLLLVDLTATLSDAHAGVGFLRVCGNISPRLSFGVLLNAATLVGPWDVSIVSATKVVLLSPVLQNAVSSSLNIVTLDWAATETSQPCILGELIALGGSPPSFYDGVRASEIGFFQRPEIFSLTQSGGVGVPAGTYSYVTTYEQIDARGQWHQSNISDPLSTTTASAKTITVLVTPLSATNRAGRPGDGQVRIALWRTTNGGTVYRRVPGVERIVDPSVAAQVLGDDTTLDTNLGAPLYTQPGIPGVAQVKVTPPPFSCMIAHGDRLVGANRKTVWFSGQTVPGEGYWFADIFQFSVEKGGDITALASLDDALVVFKRDAIAFVDGQGPPDNGVGGDFSPPSFIAADVGCIEPRSICVTPAGVLFQSLRGIEMLSRSRSLANYFGSRVEATLAANPVITSAVLDEAKGTVTFTCLPTETANTGRQIVWDYVHSIWVSDTVVSGVALKSAVMWGQQKGTLPVRAVLDSSGNIYKESTDYLDTGTYVSTDIVTPWIKMSGVQGYQRTCGLALLLESNTSCDITVKLRLDYRSDIVQTRTFTAAEIAALRTPTELWMTFKTQKCTAFQLEITDAAPAVVSMGTGQGPTYVGLRIEYGLKAGLNRAPSAAR